MSLTSLRSLKGKHFAFFGGTAGIGFAAAEALARQGAHIALIGRGVEAGQAAADGLRTLGAGDSVFIKGDLSTIAGAQAAVTKVQGWSSTLDGIVQSALNAVNEKKMTADGLEFYYAMQYQIRVVIDNLLLENLSASGDGRIIHLSGPAPAFMTPDLDDLQYEKRSWGYWKAMIGSHNLYFLFLQEASTKWKKHSVSMAAACVSSTKTKIMTDANTPLLMRMTLWFGATVEESAQNIVSYMSWSKIAEKDRFGIFWNFKKAELAAPALPAAKAEKLWAYTKKVSEDRGVKLVAM